MGITLVLNFAIIAIIAIALYYIIQLSRQISHLRKDEDKLSKAVIHFNEATERSKESVFKLKEMAFETRDELQTFVDKAELLKDELVFLIERGNSIADKIEEGITLSRNPSKEKVSPKKQKKESVPKEEVLDLKSEVEKEMYKALNQ